MFWKKIKAIYNKEDFDHTKRFVDPKIYHRIFFAVQKPYQVMDEPFAAWTYVTKSISTLSGILVLIELNLSLYHAIDIFDVSFITESGTYVLLIFYKMMTITATKVNLSNYMHLIHAMKEDFKYIETKKEKYRKVFFATQLGTWKGCFGVLALMVFVYISLATFGVGILIFHCLTHTPGDGSHRPLAFPFWAPGVDYTTTPAFEAAFTLSNISVMACCYNYTFTLQTNIVWVRQIASKADLIGMCIRDLLEGIHPTNDGAQKQHFASLINFRMKEIVSQHITMYRLLDSYAAVYRKCLMFEQFIASPLVCMLAYCSVEKMESGEIHVILIVLCLSSILVMYIPCYLCTYLRTKLSGVHDACWDIRFWDATPNIRPYLVLIMQRCLRPLPLQMPGFQEVSLKTFSSKMASAYSLFNMLRQADLDL